ncbi:amino acid permease C-terminal domain-containing protein [Streptomyces niveus]|uniref:amino acid permease C-terminal domain-containing protein n=1 Tax=Streptomyces niveus TaxID=193462 RepID=UPI0035DAE333
MFRRPRGRGSATVMVGLVEITWVVFGIRLTAGLVVYFGYGARRPRPATAQPPPAEK